MRRIDFIGWFLFLAFFASMLDWHRAIEGQNDFLSFYCGAKLVGTGYLHSAPAFYALQRQTVGVEIPSILFIRPDFYAVLLKPLGLLPYKSAYLLFGVFNALALAVFLRIFRERKELKWLALVSIPLLAGFANGQDLPLVLGFFSLAIFLDKRQFGFLAGLCLSLCTIKFHFLIFVPLALLIWKKWSVIAGGITGTALLSALAAFYEGWDWLLRYPFYLKNPLIHPEIAQFLNVRTISKAIDADSFLLLVLLTGIITCAVLYSIWALRNESFQHGLAVCLLGGILVSYHIAIHDCSLLLLIVALAPPKSVLSQGCFLISLPFAYYLLFLEGWSGTLPALLLCAVLASQIYRQWYATPCLKPLHLET